MTHGTSHTISGFIVDVIIMAFMGLFSVADVNAILGTATIGVALITSIVRLVRLVRGGKNEEEETK